MFRKVICIVLLAVFALCAVSCSSSEQTPTVTQTPESTTGTQPAAETTVATNGSELQDLADFFDKLNTGDFNDHGQTEIQCRKAHRQ